MLLVAAVFFAGCISAPQAPNGQGNTTQNTSQQNNASTQNESGQGPQLPLLQSERATYLDFNPQEYMAARAAGKIIYIEVYSAQCMQCIFFEDEMEEAFIHMASERKYANVSGFKLDAANGEFASMVGASVPNTHMVISRSGTVLTNYTGDWDRQTLLDAIARAT